MKKVNLKTLKLILHRCVISLLKITLKNMILTLVI